MHLKFYISVTKVLKPKVRKFWGLIHTFVDVTGENLVGGGRGGASFLASPILNRLQIKGTN